MSLRHSPRIVTDGLQYHVDPHISKSTRDRTYNLHPNPLDIFAFHSLAPGTSNCVVSRETGFTSPVGGIPMKMVTTGNDSHIGSYNNPVFNIAPARIGETWTVSVWARADRATTGQIFTFGNNNLGSTFLEAPAAGINITTEWQRFSFTHTMVNAGTQYIQSRLDGADTFNGATIWWDGWQIEKSSTMSAFTFKKSSTLYDLSSNAYDATLVNNPSYIPDFAGILAFDGVKDHMTFVEGRRPTISTNTGFTIGMWVNQTATQQSALWNYFHLNGALEMGTFGTGGLSFILKDNGPAGGPSVVSGNITTGWNYIAFGTSSARIPFMYHYNATTASFATASAFNAATYTIDQLYRFGSQHYGARVGSLQIYNKALTQSEVVQNYIALKGRYGL
jgi:hypothetical protein